MRHGFKILFGQRLALESKHHDDNQWRRTSLNSGGALGWGGEFLGI